MMGVARVGDESLLCCFTSTISIWWAFVLALCGDPFRRIVVVHCRLSQGRFMKTRSEWREERTCRQWTPNDNKDTDPDQS